MDEDEKAALLQSTERTSDLLSGRIPTTGTVQAPREEFLKIELVPMSLVHRLDELNADASLVQGLFWTLMGGFLGVVTALVLNGAQTGVPDKSIWVTLAALLAGACIAGFLWHRAAVRANEIKKKLYDEKMSP